MFPSTQEEILTDSEFILRREGASARENLEVLVGEHFAALRQLATALTNDPARASQAARQALLQAVQQRATYQGQATPRAWLVPFLLQALRAAPSSERRLPPPDRSLLWAVHTLESRAARLVVLTHLQGYTLPEASAALRLREPRARRLLLDAHRHLFPGLPAAPPHPRFRDLLETALLTPLDGASAATLEDHLAACLACQAYQATHQTAQEACSVALGEAYPLEPLSPEAAEALAEDLTGEIAARPPRRRFSLRSETLWIGLLILGLFTALAAYNLSENAAKGASLFPTPRPEILPPHPLAVSLSPVPQSIIRENQFPAQPRVGSQISLDGRWIVFVSDLDDLIPNDTNGFTDIFVYGLLTGESERASVSSAGTQANGNSFNPTISADGRWVAFASEASNLVPGDTAQCGSFTGPGLVDCIDIFLHDRQTGVTQLLTAPRPGLEGLSGLSYAPTISPDGRWVAFWSSAGNLVPDDAEVCQSPYRLESCPDIFLYDHDTGELARIDIGRDRLLEIDMDYSVLSLSNEAGWLVFTLEHDDRLARELGVAHDLEVVAYQRGTGEFRRVNVASDQTPGNGPALGGVVEANGDWVAFVSTASNLVPADTNNRADVFVYNLEARATERVSLGSGGEEPDADSGLLGLLGITPGGRYVTFLSGAANLRTVENPNCAIPGYPCQVYLHDRERQTTAQIATASLPNRFAQYEPYMLTFPSLSADGQWLAFAAFSFSCPIEPFCTDVFVVDTRTNEPFLLTRPLALEGGPQTQWTMVSQIGGTQEGAGPVNSVSFSPDGKLLASGSNGPGVLVWNMPEGEVAYSLSGPPGPVAGVAFSPRPLDPENWLLAAGSSDKVFLWRVGGEPPSLLYTLSDLPGSVLSIAFSPDGRYLAAGTLRGIVVVEIFLEVNDQSLTLVAEFATKQANSLAFSPDGALLAAALSDKTTWIFRLADGSIPFRLGGHEKPVLAVAFSPTGGHLATGSQDGTIIVWKLEAGEDESFKVYPLHRLPQSDWVKSLAFSPNGNFLAAGGFDSIINLWRIPEGELFATPQRSRQDQVLTLAYAPDGRTLASGSARGNIRVWQLGLPRQPASNTIIENPRFYTRSSEDEFFVFGGSALAPRNPILLDGRTAWAELPLDEAASVAAFPIRALSTLPEGWAFQGAAYDEESQLSLLYTPAGSSARDTQLVFTQSPIRFGRSQNPFDSIGASTVVEQFQVNGLVAEFVQGDWVGNVDTSQSTPQPPSPQAFTLRWDSAYPRQSLRWMQGPYQFGLVFTTDPDRPAILARADLLAMAQSLVDPTTYPREGPILVRYTVVEGDTCTWIAQRFQTTPGAIASYNGLADNCNVIFAGQTLDIPLTVARETFAITDLDCNGTFERVRLVPDPTRLAGEPLRYAALTVENTDARGLYQTTASALAGTGPAALTNLQWLSAGPCWSLIGAELAGGGFRVYHFAGNALEIALDAPGEPVSLGEPAIPYTIQLQAFTQTGATCTRTLATYVWSSPRFELQTQTSEPADCPK